MPGITALSSLSRNCALMTGKDRESTVLFQQLKIALKGKMQSPFSTPLTPITRRCSHIFLSMMFEACSYVLVGDKNKMIITVRVCCNGDEAGRRKEYAVGKSDISTSFFHSSRCSSLPCLLCFPRFSVTFPFSFHFSPFSSLPQFAKWKQPETTASVPEHTDWPQKSKPLPNNKKIVLNCINACQ